MEELIKASGKDGVEAKGLAFLLFSASAGIANHAQNPEQSSSAIAHLCRSMLDM
jgi:hypothetical protein